eukprot:TRINITY_DN1892_c0_g1_i1.p1 TRINITY_DN1892_c0_g1~~TRINITY_DN1892_c0_g1_i1.p1  ORF type:complete len:206 (-),score=71.28 TRINITY_DN1892_c0_g1_i1:304-921(-)
MAAHLLCSREMLILLFAIPLLGGVVGGSAFAGSDAGYFVEGQILLTPDQKVRMTAVKIFLDGGERVAFPRTDGRFSLHGVSAGTHLLEVAAIGVFFPPVRLDVSARLNGQVRAAMAEDPSTLLPDPLVLIPARTEEYYEKREPLSVLSILKSPMGLMVAFMVVAMVILPRLMDSIDPEEMKKMQEEMRVGSSSSSAAAPAAIRSK